MMVGIFKKLHTEEADRDAAGQRRRRGVQTPAEGGGCRGGEGDFMFL